MSLKDATCTYSCATLPGDSGAALCLIVGKVVAILQQEENPLQEVPKGARESQVVLENVMSTQRGYDQQGVVLIACAIAEELQERPCVCCGACTSRALRTRRPCSHCHK